LNKIRKIACITYTNIAVETILTRLSTSATRVDVSTIHSFLYRHIVKPYAFLIADEYGLNYSKLDGHDELNHSYSKINNWLELTNQKYFISEQNKLIHAL
ncbi:ATP-dependent helicase, partial [Acinetobacter baumannii]|nr:ATP-dependent helicase [Acinetobacter baumannii]